MTNVYTSILKLSGRSERGVRRLLNAIRAATGSDDAQLVSSFFALAESWSDEQGASLIKEHTKTPMSDIKVPGRSSNQVRRRIESLQKRGLLSPVTQETETCGRCGRHI